MSRYTIRWKPTEVVVGWDPPLGTFFAHQYDPTVEDDELVWAVGLAARELPTLAGLKTALAERGLPEIPLEIQACLNADSEAAWVPGPLQKALGFIGKKTP